jgi:ABC-type amino acid transport substrate-binding protein
MYYDTETIVRERRYDGASLLTPTESRAPKRASLSMGRAVENFHRMSADKVEMRGNGRMRQSANSVIRALFGTAAVLGIAVATLPSDAAARAPVACGATYTIERGDTLFRIAKRAYGNGKLYKQIHQANSDILTNSSSVEIGDALMIPCLDNTGQAVRQDAVEQAALTELAQPVPGPLQQTEDLGAIAGLFDRNSDPANDMLDAIAEVGLEKTPDMPPPIRLLASSGGAPFTDADLPQGGMITDLLSRAVNLASPGQQSHVTFIDDRAEHLETLLPDNTFDVSFPWTKPACGKSDKLSAKLQKRCAEFEFSNPILEVRLGFYTRTGDALDGASTFAALSGKRLCRPAEPFIVDLEQYGLVEPNVSVQTRYNAAQCFALLIGGQVDVVTLVESEASVHLAKQVFAGAVAEIDGLEAWQTLHALVSKQNPNARDMLDTINRGLTELMASGEWFRVVSTHQSQQIALMN